MAVPRNTYLVVADDLRKKIEDGTYTRTLPTLGEIGRQHGVTRGVAIRAVHKLRDEGLLDIFQGAGAYVAGTANRNELRDQITDLMRSERMTVGALFPSERELCARLGVSRIRVRGALAHLEGQGLIGTLTGRGRIVLALPAKKRS